MGLADGCQHPPSSDMSTLKAHHSSTEEESALDSVEEEKTSSSSSYETCPNSTEPSSEAIHSSSGRFNRYPRPHHPSPHPSPHQASAVSPPAHPQLAPVPLLGLQHHLRPPLLPPDLRDHVRLLQERQRRLIRRQSRQHPTSVANHHRPLLHPPPHHPALRHHHCAAPSLARALRRHSRHRAPRSHPRPWQNRQLAVTWQIMCQLRGGKRRERCCRQCRARLWGRRDRTAWVGQPLRAPRRGFSCDMCCVSCIGRCCILCTGSISF